MNHRITIDEARLNANYEKMMDEVYLLYHTHPSNLIPISLSEAEKAEQSEYDAMGRGLANRYHGRTWGGSGAKCVRFQESETCNGLPRHK